MEFQKARRRYGHISLSPSICRLLSRIQSHFIIPQSHFIIPNISPRPLTSRPSAQSPSSQSESFDASQHFRSSPPELLLLTSLAPVQQLKSGSHNDRQVIISVTCPGTTEPRSCHTVRHLTCATARQRRLLDAWAVAGTPQGSAATPSRSKPCTWCLPPVPRSPRPRPLCACPASSSAGAPVARFKAIADSTLPAGLDRAEVPAQGIRCIDTFVGPQGGGYPSNSAEQLRRPLDGALAQSRRLRQPKGEFPRPA